jgi:Na+/proline symporter
MTSLDYAVLLGYFLVSMAIGLWFLHRVAGRMKSLSQFFLSGRSLPWWLLGTSMVATTFAADTPILVSHVAAEFGLYTLWMFQPLILTATLTTFFFARLWRRSRVLTDVEYLELRYSGKSGRFLRGFKALYQGALLNTLIIGTQLIAIGEIGQVVMGIDRNIVMLAGAMIALIYSVIAGFTGVVVTDFLQFVLAMAGSLLLAVFVLAMPEVGGLSGLVGQLAGGVVRDTGEQVVTVPVLHMMPGKDTPFFTLSLMLIPLLVSWWSVVYGGMEPGGGGQVVQRILAAKNEKHAVGASLWFNIAHFALRMWPWLLVGLAAVILYPDTTDFKSVYARAIRDVLPSGVRGLLVASFFAAFISTMDTRLNLGSAYLVNDFYRRFAAIGKSEKHYVMVSRIVTVLACAIPFAIPYLFERSILNVVMFWMQITAGTGLVFILRWYWWRVNAWSEISAMVSAVVYTLLILWLRYGWDIETYTRPDVSLHNILYVTVLTTVTWLAVTLLTSPESKEGLREFYRRTRPPGIGWRAISRDLEDLAVTSPDDPKACLIGWVTASVFLFAAFYGVGKLLLLQFAWGTFWVAVSIAALLLSLKAIRRVFA